MLDVVDIQFGMTQQAPLTMANSTMVCPTLFIFSRMLCSFLSGGISSFTRGSVSSEVARMIAQQSEIGN